MKKPGARRDFGAYWRSRLGEARARAAGNGPRLSSDEIEALKAKLLTIDVTPPENAALLWSGRDILTDVPLDEAAPEGPRWWDKLSCREAELFGALGVACRLEDTPGGQFLAAMQLHYKENDPLFRVAEEFWAIVSHRFAAAAAGCVEIICEGAFEESVLRTVELETLLCNTRITAINGLDRKHFPSSAAGAFRLLRRWDVERARRYSDFIALDADSTRHERETAIDDFREVQLWYEQDFFDDLGPDRELPALAEGAAGEVDRARSLGTWKYSTQWREFIRSDAEGREHDSQLP